MASSALYSGLSISGWTHLPIGLKTKDWTKCFHVKSWNYIKHLWCIDAKELSLNDNQRQGEHINKKKLLLHESGSKWNKSSKRVVIMLSHQQ